ncbi:MAG: FkbM family methyltransferase [Bacteriovoracales bacterium]|nr:FkbM family methyltransferase [Bacteriovoracales bacterium]
MRVFVKFGPLNNIQKKSLPIKGAGIIHLDITQKIQFIQWVRPVYEKRIFEVISQILEEGDNCIDCGAHVGYWTLVFSHFVGKTGHVFSFEPDEENFRPLARNVKSLNNISITNVALFNKNGVGTLYQNPKNEGGGSLFNDVKKDNYPQLEIKTLKLDDFDKLPSKKIKLIKIDAEGSEIDILDGARKVMENEALRPQFCIIECSKREIQKRRTLFDIMKSYNYSSKPLEGEEEILFVEKDLPALYN